MGQTAWAREASELYFQATYGADIGTIGDARARYLELIKIAEETAKAPPGKMLDAIKRRATPYAMARLSGKFPEEAFEKAAMTKPIVVGEEENSN